MTASPSLRKLVWRILADIPEDSKHYKKGKNRSGWGRHTTPARATAPPQSFSYPQATPPKAVSYTTTLRELTAMMDIPAGSGHSGLVAGFQREGLDPTALENVKAAVQANYRARRLAQLEQQHRHTASRERLDHIRRKYRENCMFVVEYAKLARADVEYRYGGVHREIQRTGLDPLVMPQRLSWYT